MKRNRFTVEQMRGAQGKDFPSARLTSALFTFCSHHFGFKRIKKDS